MLDPKVNCIDCVMEPTDERGGLFIGSVYSTEADIIEKYNIKAVVSVMAGEDQVAYLKISSFCVPIVDLASENVIGHFIQTNDYISACQNNRRNVLVHCLAGISRSAAVILAYLMYSKRQSLDDAIQYLKLRRSQIKPNKGFMEQLRCYEKYLNETETE